MMKKKDRPHQRRGSRSNAHVGKSFERKISNYFISNGILLEENFSVKVSVNGQAKEHRFDLGSQKYKLIVECKSHKWTESDKIPVAKMTTWNEVMLYFLAAPKKFRKVLVVLKDSSRKRKQTLAQYYLRIHGHLVPKGVEIWEYQVRTKRMTIVTRN